MSIYIYQIYVRTLYIYIYIFNLASIVPQISFKSNLCLLEKRRLANKFRGCKSGYNSPEKIPTLRPNSRNSIRNIIDSTKSYFHRKPLTIPKVKTERGVHVLNKIAQVYTRITPIRQRNLPGSLKSSIKNQKLNYETNGGSVVLNQRKNDTIKKRKYFDDGVEN